MHTPLAPGTEFDVIQRVWRALGDRHAPTGDDCTFLTVGSERLAFTSDVSIEGTHFRRGWISMEEIGWRATTAALSDVAAVAGQPIGVLTSLGMHEEWPEDWTVDLMQGVGHAAAAVGAKVLGGDLVRSDVLVIDVCVVARASTPLTRGGATTGDALYVTGTLGGPVAAIAHWGAGKSPNDEARARFAHPAARIEEAAWLREVGASAMIDVSDGVLADAAHLARASGVCCEVDADRVPVHASATEEQALTGGEEFELLFAIPDRPDLIERFSNRFDLEMTRIGQCTQGSGVHLTRAGSPAPIPQGYRHF
jgi:thiamine-monophosphate kinase